MLGVAEIHNSQGEKQMRKRVLEIGAGNDSFFQHFQTKGMTVITDPHDFILEEGKEYLDWIRRRGKGSREFATANASALPFGDSQFDEVIARNFYGIKPGDLLLLVARNHEELEKLYGLTGKELDEMIEKIDARKAHAKILTSATDEIHRVLKPGGRLIVVNTHVDVPKIDDEEVSYRRQGVKKFLPHQGLTKSLESLDNNDPAAIEKALGYRLYKDSVLYRALASKMRNKLPNPTVDIHIFRKKR